MLSQRKVLLLAVLSVAPAAAQVPSMSLPEALDYAQQHQPSLKAAQARAQAALAQAAVPWAQWAPRLGATAQVLVGTANNTTASYVGAGGIDIPRIGATASYPSPTASPGWTPYGSTFAGIGFRQELFDFGKIAAQAAVFDAAASAEKSRADVVRLDLELAVKQAYFAVLAAKAILNASEAAYQRAKEERDDVSARVQAGMRSPIDVTRPEADLMRFDAGRIRARGSLATAQAVLAAIVGYPQALLDTSGPAPEATPPPAMKAALERSLEQNPEVQLFEQRLKSQKALSRSVFMELLPDLWATGTFSGREGGATPNGFTSYAPAAAGFAPGVPNWDLGVVLSWQFFDLTVLKRRDVSLRGEEAASADLDAVRMTTSSAIQQMYYALDVAKEALPALRRAVDAAKANDDQAHARFKAGLGNAVELADADAVLIDADIQLALGQFESDRARAQLARAIAEPP
jgi:outer membrane protein